MFQSPLKTVVDKLKPVESKSPITSLRFERSSDFKKFIKFIKVETKELEKIKIPTETEIKPKSKTPLVGILGLGAFGILANLFSGDGDKKNKDVNRVTSLKGGTPDILSSSILGSRKVKRNFKTTLTPDKTKARRMRRRFKKVINRVKVGEKKDGTPKFMSINKFLRRQKKDIKNFLKERRDLIRVTDKLRMEGFKITDPAYYNQLSRIADIEKIIKDELFVRKFLGKEIPFGKTTVTILKNLMQEAKILGEGGDRAREELSSFIDRDPKFKVEVLDEVKKLDPLLFDVQPGDTAISKIFGKFGTKARLFGEGIENRMIITRDFLDRQFTKVGKFTKGFRKGTSSLAKKTPIIGSSIRFFKNPVVAKTLNKGNFLLLAGTTAYDIGDTLVKGDTIFHGFYNTFVRFNNEYGAGSKDPSKLRVLKGRITGAGLFLPQSRIDKINASRDSYNQEVLRRRGDQINNQLSSARRNNQGIIPFVTSATKTPFNITLVPTVLATKFIINKLYTQ